MQRAAVLALVAALAAPAAGETPMTPEAFEALAEGRTLHFSLDGAPFGAEQFLPGRRTLWRFADETCEPGRWRAEGAAICFEYVSEPGPICWRVLQGVPGLTAALLEGGAETGFRLQLDRIDPAPLPCPGPRVGS
jgi:hypothetical protein